MFHTISHQEAELGSLDDDDTEIREDSSDPIMDSDSLEEEFFELIRNWFKLSAEVKRTVLDLAKRES